MTSTTGTAQLDTAELEQRVKLMYEEVAREPERDFHFETGRPLAERLGYPPAQLDRIPAAAIDSFAGVGHFLDPAAIAPGETVLDLGSGSGTDSFLAALATGTAIEAAGLTIETWRENPEYGFVSERADNATTKYGVTSVSLLARPR